MEHRWSIALGATASVSDDLRFVVETDGTGMGTCVYSVETLLKREILRQAERIRELQGELRGKAALESLVGYKNARIAALEAQNRRWMECAGKQFQDLVNLRAELATAQTRLARLDALLESKETPEGLVKSLTPIAIDGSCDIVTAALRAWRWIRDFLRGPIDDPVPDKEPDPQEVAKRWEEWKRRFDPGASVADLDASDKPPVVTIGEVEEWKRRTLLSNESVPEGLMDATDEWAGETRGKVLTAAWRWFREQFR